MTSSAQTTGADVIYDVYLNAGLTWGTTEGGVPGLNDILFDTDPIQSTRRTGYWRSGVDATT